MHGLQLGYICVYADVDGIIELSCCIIRVRSLCFVYSNYQVKPPLVSALG
jgi:hypothetical protein